jgi:hypothetical protein
MNHATSASARAQINFVEPIDDVSAEARETSVIKQVIAIINLALFHPLFPLCVCGCRSQITARACVINERSITQVPRRGDAREIENSFAGRVQTRTFTPPLIHPSIHPPTHPPSSTLPPRPAAAPSPISRSQSRLISTISRGFCERPDSIYIARYIVHRAARNNDDGASTNMFLIK